MRLENYKIIIPENDFMVKFQPFMMTYDNWDYQNMFVYFSELRFLSTPVFPPFLN